MADAGFEELADQVLDLALRGSWAEAEARLAAAELSAEQTAHLRRLLADLSPGGSAGAAGPPEGTAFGDFRLKRELGRGGVGVVYEAEQQPLGRTVALKLLRPELTGSTAARARFAREAQVIARLDHPHVVRVLAAGEAQGRCYIAMELIQGVGLQQRVAQGIPPWREVARWGAELAEALAAAHAAGVIHRDVKPSNVRVTPDGRALLLDFGLAQHAAMSLTQSDGFRGSPYYASPEQVERGGVPLDARTDVYSLGVCLYQCLTGRVPFEGETTTQVFQQILRADPVAPRRLNPALPRDLETIVLAAMEKEPARRYPGAGAMAADLRALLADRPIARRAPGPLERGAKWVRRNPDAAAAAALAVLAPALLAAQQFSAAGRLRAEVQRVEAGRALLQAREALPQDPGLALLLAMRSLELQDSPLARGTLLHALDTCREVRTFVGHEEGVNVIALNPDGRRLFSGAADGFVRVWELESGRCLQQMKVDGRTIQSGAWSPDGERIAVTSSDGFVRVFTSSGELQHTWVPREGRALCLAWCRAGTEVAAGCDNGHLYSWNAASGAESASYVEAMRKCSKLFTDPRDPDAVLGVFWDGTARRVDLSGRTPARVFRHGERPLIVVAFLRGGAELVTADYGDTWKLWNTATGAVEREGACASDGARTVAAASDGSWIAVPRPDAQRIELHSTSGPGLVIEHPWSIVERMTLSADGRWLAAIGDSYEIRIWSTDTGALAGRLLGHGDAISDFEFTRDGAHLISSSLDGSVRLWRPDGFDFVHRIREQGASWAHCTPSPDGSMLLAIDQEGGLAGVPLAAGSVSHDWQANVALASFSRSGRYVAAFESRPGNKGATRLHLLEAATGTTLATADCDFVNVTPESFGQADERIVVFRAGVPTVLGVPGLAVELELPKLPRYPEYTRFSPDGKWVALQANPLFLRVAAPSDGEAVLEFDHPVLTKCAPAWHPDGGSLAVADLNGKVFLLDLAAREARWRRQVATDQVEQLTFAPDGRWLLVRTSGASVYLLDPISGETRQQLIGNESSVVRTAIRGDGTWIATSAKDGTIRLWNADTASEVTRLSWGRIEARWLAFTPDGRFLIAPADDGGAVLWPLADPLSMARAAAPRALTAREKRRLQIE